MKTAFDSDPPYLLEFLYRLSTTSSQSSSNILLEVYERGRDSVSSSYVREVLKQRK